jgi:hypothetical protein
MKTFFAGLLILVSVTGLNAQTTATNFTCNDCSGVMYDLFTELDAGKVVVIDWVMPCGSCVGPSQTAYNMVNSYQTSHPGKVLFFMADDYANSSCITINAWANQYGMPESAWSRRFVNNAIRMLDYGSNGMPKIVVLGGASHTVFYNANNTVNATALQNAINAALTVSSLEEGKGFIHSLTTFPNPATDKATLKFNLEKSSEVLIELFNLNGQKIKDVFSGRMNSGEGITDIDTSKLSSGVYLVKVSASGKTNYVNLVVSH